MNLPSVIKKRVADATFKIRTKDCGEGQCVLVVGGLVITAAHCVDWHCTGEMTLGDFYLSKIETGGGDLIAQALAVEPVSDVAILGRPDDQELWDKSEAFDQFCEHTIPLKLLQTTPSPRVPFPVWICTHRRTWVAGTATYFGNTSIFSYETKCAVEPGTSGGPIVNRSGELVGVVSHGGANCVRGVFISAAPLLSLALPAWLLARIAES